MTLTLIPDPETHLLNRAKTDTAALVCAVADHNPDEVAAILTPLNTTQLHALAVTLAAHINPDQPLIDHTTNRIDPIAAALQYTAQRWNTTTAAILSRSRRREHTEARAVVCYTAHRLGLTHSEIGRRLDRNHTTVMYAVSRVGENPRLRSIANDLLHNLDPHHNIRNEQQREAS